jgi:membrane dipeptidase
MHKTTRRAAIAGSMALVGGALWWSRSRKPPLGMDIPQEFLERGAALIGANPTVDVHSHPGRFFLTGATPDSFIFRIMRDGFEAERIADMRAAEVTASLFSIVADLALLGLEDGGLRAVREFEPNEAYVDFNRQLDRLRTIIDAGLISLALSPDDIRTAHEAGNAVAILTSEGADFIEEDLARIAEAHASGLRSITLVHYHTNSLGDIQTSEPAHYGLTPFGLDVVQEMNRLGMIVDVAHASYATCVDAVAASSAPVMLSHSNLDSGTVSSPRFISGEHARLIADAGGIVGAWPAGIGSDSLADFVEQILALIDVAGVEHVAIGSDMDGNYKPVLTEYADFPLLAAALLYRGRSEQDVARVLGGNFLRLFDDVTAA